MAALPAGGRAEYMAEIGMPGSEHVPDSALGLTLEELKAVFDVAEHWPVYAVNAASSLGPRTLDQWRVVLDLLAATLKPVFDDVRINPPVVVADDLLG